MPVSGVHVLGYSVVVNGVSVFEVKAILLESSSEAMRRNAIVATGRPEQVVASGFLVHLTDVPL